MWTVPSGATSPHLRPALMLFSKTVCRTMHITGRTRNGDSVNGDILPRFLVHDLCRTSVLVIVSTVLQKGNMATVQLNPSRCALLALMMMMLATPSLATYTVFWLDTSRHPWS